MAKKIIKKKKKIASKKKVIKKVQKKKAVAKKKPVKKVAKKKSVKKKIAKMIINEANVLTEKVKTAAEISREAFEYYMTKIAGI